jgi:hypothetical protein
MRTTSALCLLLLAGCAAGAQDPAPQPGILRARTIVHANGTGEPVAIKLDNSFVVIQGLGLCETNDPMPTFAPRQVAPMLRAPTPKQPVPNMPNLCPVTRQARGPKTRATTIPPGVKGSRPPAEGESQP